MLERIDNETLVLVFGDHGSDPSGHHGGNTDLELNSILFAYQREAFLLDDRFFSGEERVKDSTGAKK